MTPETDQLAAIDLGSNSFHMIVARRMGESFQIIDRLREPVRLANGLDEQGNLSHEAQQRALDCLERFGQRLSGISPDNIRIVGTNTLRKANNAEDFLSRAELALGNPVQIIAGVEEARLIYLGVAQTLATDGQRLVIDIGGGSTEFIIGQGNTPLRMESLHMGCVTMTNRHFRDGKITEKCFEQARMSALQELEPMARGYRSMGWHCATGASGSIRAIAKVAEANGWGSHGITLQLLQHLGQVIQAQRNINELQLAGLSEDRRPVFVGGVVILLAAFESLGIELMNVADGALREGLICDLLGRLRHDDIRNRTAKALALRYHSDQEQVQRVADTALNCLKQVAGPWGLNMSQHGTWLHWAATLHEIGIDIAHSQFHKHGAYIVENADLAGFSRQEQRILAAIIVNHRRRFSLKHYKTLPAPWDKQAPLLTILLRLATLLHRARQPQALPSFDLRASGTTLHLAFPSGWLELNPLTRADLEQESTWLTEAKLTLSFS